MDGLEAFVRDIALKNDGNDPISNEFFNLIAKSFGRITLNPIFQLRLVEEAVVYSIGIVMDLIDPNSNFKKALDSGLDKYIENEPLIRVRDKSSKELVRITIVRVAYYMLFLKIGLDDELTIPVRTKDIEEQFRCIFNKYIPWSKVASDTQLSKEDFFQKIKFVYRQVYRGLPDVYLPANMFMSVSLIDLSDFERKEWRYFINFSNLDKCLRLLSSNRWNIEKKRLYEFIDRRMPELMHEYTSSQMDHIISLHQANMALNSQLLQIKSKVDTYALGKSNTASEELLSMIFRLQEKLNELTMSNIALESINVSHQREIANLRQTVEEQKKELDDMKHIKQGISEKPDPLSFYIENPDILKRIIEYAESESCTKKIHVYKYIYRVLLDSGMSIEILRSAEFIRALLPHLIYVKGINAQEKRKQDVLNLQQVIRINDAKHG